MSLLFSPYRLPAARGDLTLPNRIVIAPMCQYASTDGQASDWHLMHWANLMNSGAGMLTIEATAVTPEGRITPGCLGLWDEATRSALESYLHRARALAPHMPVCIQLAHAGRKASSAKPWEGGQLIAPDQGGWIPQGPSALSQLAHEPAPHAMTSADLARVRDAFVLAAQRAHDMGIDAIELHSAHGYLLHSFLSPVSNQRTDAYGGSLANRMRFPLEVFDAVRAAYDGVLGVRLSAMDWVDNGWDVEQSQVFAKALAQQGCNFMHVSSGGVSPAQKIPLGPGYQMPLAQAIRQACGIPTIGVGLIQDAAQAQGHLQAGDCDLVGLARSFLYNPRWAWQAAAELGAVVPAMPAYWRSLPRHAQAIFGPDAKVGGR